MKCKTCKGRKKVSTPFGLRKCHTCDGTGESSERVDQLMIDRSQDIWIATYETESDIYRVITAYSSEAKAKQACVNVAAGFNVEKKVKLQWLKMDEAGEVADYGGITFRVESRILNGVSDA